MDRRGTSGEARSCAIGMVGTYPPTRCGIATFSEALTAALTGSCPWARVEVIACVDRPGEVERPPQVTGELVRGSITSRAAAVEALAHCDVVIVQHEFGIYGGDAGAEVVDLVTALPAPVVVVLHTVLLEPTAAQRVVVEELCDVAAAVILPTDAARRRLLAGYDVPPERLHTIPHGADPNLPPRAPPADARERSPLLLSWGLLSPGKGIELALEAVAALADLPFPPRYLVVGQTHPKVREAEGERYRESLQALARALAIEHRVTFDDRYDDRQQILALTRRADVVVLPYRSREQVVSGVLVEAIASGTPVVATAFPHACELLAPGAGLVVPHDDPAALADALRRLCTDGALAAHAVDAARREAPRHFWPNVASAYGALLEAVRAREAEAVGI